MSQQNPRFTIQKSKHYCKNSRKKDCKTEMISTQLIFKICSTEKREDSAYKKREALRERRVLTIRILL
jgi:hypothetical protein